MGRTIGFVGTGIMGRGMARSLAIKFFELATGTEIKPRSS